jgi:hypothetical protein
VSHPIPEYLVKRLQHLQGAAAGFVVGRYATKLDVLKLGWLPIKERIYFHLTQAMFKALYFDQWPSYLKPELYTPGRTLRSSSETKLTVPLENDTFLKPVLQIFLIFYPKKLETVVFLMILGKLLKHTILKSRTKD